VVKAGLGPKGPISPSRRALGRGQSSFLVYLCLALLLLATEALVPAIPERARMIAIDVVSPILSVTERPIRAVQGGLERIAGVSDIYVENAELKAEIRALKQFKTATIELNRENERLRAMLRAPSREIPVTATARVIGVGGGAFERTILLDVGGSQGVQQDSPVLDDTGVIGRVIVVGQNSSRVLLLSDLNSHIPVRSDRSGALGILRGQNGPEMLLDFVEDSDQVTVGDVLVTSGHATVFPPDLAIARVSRKTDTAIYAVPIAGIERLANVRVLQYHPLPPEAEIVSGTEQ